MVIKKDRSNHNAPLKAFEFLQCQEKMISKLFKRSNYRQNNVEERFNPHFFGLSKLISIGL